MRLPKAKLLLAAALVVSIALAFAGLAIWSASRALKRAALEVAKEENLGFAVLRWDRANSSGVEWIGSPAVFDDAAFFDGRLYICGPLGLTAYSPEGELVARYRTGLELPAFPLVSMAVGRTAEAAAPELYVATAGGGLLAFDENGLRQILPETRPLRHLTSVLPLATGRILLGTGKNGVLVYDGRRLTEFQPQLKNLHVTALAGDDSSVWVGTLREGVVHWHAGQADHFTEAEGLPDPRVLSLAVAGERTFVGTPLGVAEFRAGQFVRTLAPGFFATSLLCEGQTLLVGTLDEGIVDIPLTPHPGASSHRRGQEIPGRVMRLISNGGTQYALTGNALTSFDPRGSGWKSVIEREDALLADGNISALAFDPAGRLWVGYFDRGLDVLGARGERATHIEDEHVFCVNRIVPDPQRHTTHVATANGLVEFDGALREREVLGRREGLIADHVTDVALTPEGTTLATPAGLTFLDADGARSIYAFHGLVNNHVYTLAAEGTHLLAGTLGGISLLDRGQVRRNYTTANSALKANWITALAPVGDEWFVGSYGAGIFRLDASGYFRRFPDTPDAFVVNPNAMLVTPQRVYAGTMERGLYVYDRAHERWSVVTRGLPSLNVTALAVRNNEIYVGTDNGLIRIPEQDLSNP